VVVLLTIIVNIWQQVKNSGKITYSTSAALVLGVDGIISLVSGSIVAALGMATKEIPNSS